MVLNRRKSKQTLKHFVDKIQVLAVVCNQWGDTGKGKFVDFFSGWADIIARGTGGANAGHTINVGGKEYIFNLIPSGILYDQYGKINVLGNGMVLHMPRLIEELEKLNELEISYSNLRISSNAHVTMPYHILLELVSEKAKGKKAIGTTLRAIGPTYADKIRRTGVRVNDLLNPAKLEEKVKENYAFTEAVLKGVFGLRKKDIAQLMKDERLGSGRYVYKGKVNISEIVAHYSFMGNEIKHLITDTKELIERKLSKGKKLLLEGAQGLLLGIDHGTFPYVTSSDPSINGLCSGVGISALSVDLCLGLVKAPYMTRVGGGPFPTELEDEALAEKIRKKGREYGATTGRPRRIGWTDLVALKYAVGINGPNLVLTKMDICDGFEELKICKKYIYSNEEKSIINGKEFSKGKTTTSFISDGEMLSKFKPVYETAKGWEGPINEFEAYNDLPKELRNYIRAIEKFTGGKVRAISVGPGREETIIRD